MYLHFLRGVGGGVGAMEYSVSIFNFFHVAIDPRQLYHTREKEVDHTREKEVELFGLFLSHIPTL